MMERILLNRLVYRIGKLDVGVNGFTQRRSAANCLANYAANNEARTIVFLDIEKAFDRAQSLVILDELVKMGLKGKILMWIKRYLTDRKARVIFQGKVSDYHTLENGTPQGGVISPMLFNVLMNTLAKLPYPAGTLHIGYADDVALQTSGRDSFTKMQESLDLIADKCEEIGFSISRTKTKSIAKTRDLPQNRLQVQGQDIEYVDAHKYLGVVVARTNSGKATVEQLKSKCNARIRVLKAMSWKGMGTSGAVIIRAYKALVRSLIDYASPVLMNMSKEDIEKPESIQNESLRIALGAPGSAKCENLRVETGMMTIADRIKYMNANLTVKTAIGDDHPETMEPHSWTDERGGESGAGGLPRL